MTGPQAGVTREGVKHEGQLKAVPAPAGSGQGRNWKLCKDFPGNSWLDFSLQLDNCLSGCSHWFLDIQETGKCYVSLQCYLTQLLLF